MTGPHGLSAIESEGGPLGSLSLVGRYGDAGAITLERELVSGEVLDGTLLP